MSDPYDHSFLEMTRIMELQTYTHTSSYRGGAHLKSLLDHFYLAKSFHKGGVPFHRHGHCGVDTACEGDVDEGQEDGDGLEQGQVLRHDGHSWDICYVCYLGW